MARVPVDTIASCCIFTRWLLLGRRWRVGLREVLAGLLLEGPAHGYRLHATLEAELGPLWQTRASQVYLTLGRMERDGLASSRRVRQATRPDRQLLELTERGRALAERWLSGPGAPDEAVVRLAALRDRAAEVAVAPRGHRKGDGQVARPA